MLWTGLDRLGTCVIQFVIEILIARVLLPSDYGLIGMLAIFMIIAQTFIDSGFLNALIQKKDRNLNDYSTVFYFSIIVASVIYLILYFSAPFIADFYHQPVLCKVARVYLLTLIINSFSITQTAKLTIDLNFKVQAITSILSIIISGSIGIYLAYNGFGVWALVWQGITAAFVRTITIWIASRWKPLLVFSKESFDRLFSFGSKLLASSLINNVYNKISTLIIGKAFHATELGFFTRAQQFCQLPTQTITNIVIKVNYPILAELQDNDEKLVESYKILLRTPIFILYPLLFGMSVLATLSSINLNLLYVKGQTNLVLKLEFIKKPIAFTLLFCSIPFGLNGICCAIALYNFIAFAFNCYYTGKILDFGFFKQVKAILPIFIYSIIMSILVYASTFVLDMPMSKLLVGISVGVISYFIISLLSRDSSLFQLLRLIKLRKSNEI